MGLLQQGKWVDKWYDTKNSDGEFRRQDSRFRRWLTVSGEAAPNNEQGFKAEKADIICMFPWLILGHIEPLFSER